MMMPMITMTATTETPGKMRLTISSLSPKRLLMNTPRATGASTMVKIFSIMAGTGTGTFCPIYSQVSNGVRNIASTVDTAVRVMDTATSPFAR